ncbi:uncharacterized protein [Periplaneta americana]|uniref:uncharacterized protein n=1 Tax=Periplaneta americana TaxID=6978 RepID=UPI0037E9AF38
MNELDITKKLNIEISSEDYNRIVVSDVFIDKTLLVKEFFLESVDEEPKMEKVLITAPGYCGKSINMDMMRKFFEIQVDEEGNPKTCVKRNEAGKWMEDKERMPASNFKLFKNNNLKIYQCQCRTKYTVEQCRNGTCQNRQFFYEHCGQHPVIFVNFKNVQCQTWQRFMDSLRNVLRDAFLVHQYLGEDTSSHLSKSKWQQFDRYSNGVRCRDLSEEEVLFGLEFLAECLHEQFNRKVIILIDEFDVPIMRLIYDPEDFKLEYIHEVVEFISIMIFKVLNGNKHVLGGVINACSLLATTLLLYANNIEICPFLENHRFSEYYGFTKDEVDMLLNKPQFKGFDEWEILNYYSGYQVYGSGTKLFCVYSFVNYLQDWSEKRNPQKKENYNCREKNQHNLGRYWTGMYGIAVLCLQKLYKNEDIRKKISVIQSHGSISIRNVGYRLTPQDILHLKMLISQSISSYPNDNDIDLFVQYLKDHGYFNIIKENQWWCTLEVPSGEIRDEITRTFFFI